MAHATFGDLVAELNARSRKLTGQRPTVSMGQDVKIKAPEPKVSHTGTSEQAREIQKKLKGAKDAGDGIKIVYNALLGGWFCVRGPAQTPLGGKFYSKEEAQAWLKRSK